MFIDGLFSLENLDLIVNKVDWFLNFQLRCLRLGLNVTSKGKL